ncbi:MAG TPA: PqqD family protein [Acidobacteriaceae bacterium]
MTYAGEDKPRHIETGDLILEELPGELMIYDRKRNKAYCLNQTTAFVWKHADGKRTVAELAELMGQVIGRPVHVQLIWYALDVLAKDGLLEMSTLSAGMTRRALLKKMGMGVAVPVPVVTADRAESV